MPELVVPISEARASLAALLGRVVDGSERIALSRHGRVVAALVPAHDLSRLDRLDAARDGRSAGVARDKGGRAYSSPGRAAGGGSLDLVLVPGAFLGPWVFADVVRLLARAGISAGVVALPSASGRPVGVEDDLRALRQVLDAAPAAVVCGHGYGAALVSALGARPGTERLVFIAGVVPGRGERVGDRLDADLDAGILGIGSTTGSGAIARLYPGAAGGLLFADCAAPRRAVAESRLRPFSLGALDLVIDEPAWCHAPTTLVLTAGDGRASLLSPEIFDSALETTELASGPCPQWSQPELVSAVLADVVGRTRAEELTPLRSDGDGPTTCRRRSVERKRAAGRRRESRHGTGVAFRFPDPVNDVAARTVAAGVVCLCALVLGLSQPWLIVPLAYGFVARTATGPRLSPLGQFATRIVAPRLGRHARLVPGPPKRFAQSIGAAMSLAALGCFLSGHLTGARILIAVLIVPATLEAALGYCVACQIFALGMRLGLVPASACARCAELWGPPRPSTDAGSREVTSTGA